MSAGDTSVSLLTYLFPWPQLGSSSRQRSYLGSRTGACTLGHLLGPGFATFSPSRLANAAISYQRRLSFQKHEQEPEPETESEQQQQQETVRGRQLQVLWRNSSDRARGVLLPPGASRCGGTTAGCGGARRGLCSGRVGLWHLVGSGSGELSGCLSGGRKPGICGGDRGIEVGFGRDGVGGGRGALGGSEQQGESASCIRNESEEFTKCRGG